MASLSRHQIIRDYFQIDPDESTSTLNQSRRKNGGWKSKVTYRILAVQTLRNKENTLT